MEKMNETLGHRSIASNLRRQQSRTKNGRLRKQWVCAMEESSDYTGAHWFRLLVRGTCCMPEKLVGLRYQLRQNNKRQLRRRTGSRGLNKPRRDSANAC